MAEQQVLLARSTTTPVENKVRREVVLPGRPSQDFILTAKCRIVNVGERISLSAADLPSDTGGLYTWSTASSKIRLANTTGEILAIEALTTPGTARDSEIITVTRTASDGSKKTKTVALTVAKVTFGQASTQLYGYDDFDTPHGWSDDHVSVKSGGETFVAVKIEGGALGTDFDFVCDDIAACTADPAPGAADFALPLKAKTWQRKSTVLQAKAKCPSGAIFAAITLHVYTEKVVKVVVAKVADSNSAATKLNFADVDYTAHQNAANDKLKEAVVKFELRNFNAANSVTNIAFDKDSDGALSFDINAQGGADVELLNSTIAVMDDEHRVVIVRQMRSFYYLSRAAKRGDTSISVRGTDVFAASMPLGIGTTQEMVTVTGNSENVAHLAAPLRFDHAIGEALEFPAAGWSSDPIILAEGDTSLEVAKWTIVHEVGHSALEFDDIMDPTNLMHFDQTDTDHRLRYCPRDSKHRPGETENQWEKIPRSLPEKPTIK